MITEEDSKMIKDLVERIVQARDQSRTGQRESSSLVQSPTHAENKVNGRGRRKNGVGKLRKTPVKTAKQGVGELVPQPHGGALRRGNPGNRGGGRPSHVVKQTLCGDLETLHDRIISRLNDPSLRFLDMLDLYGELLVKLERYGF